MRTRTPLAVCWNAIGLVVLLFGFLASNAGPAAAQDVSTSKANVRAIELTVVGPGGKPVPAASVEVRARPPLTEEQVAVGKFVRKAAYGVFTAADEQGRLRIILPPTLKQFDVSIVMPGFGPYTARWSPESSSEPIPEQFTAELEAGWSIGGIVVDSDGKPVAGASVRPSIEYKKAGAIQRQLGVGANIKTDTAGKWHFDSVPISMNEVQFEINHPDFRPNRSTLTRSEYEITPGQEPATRIVIDRGLTVAGKVIDDAGNPIAGALVRTKFLNDLRQTKTDESGVYRLSGCEPKLARIVVSAKGRATDVQEVRIEPDMAPVDFQMKLGGKIRIRVVDEQGNGIPKARIFFQRWRFPDYQYFELDNINQYADRDGVWEWNEAPLDQIEADICRPDGMALSRRPIVAREEEYVFHPPPALVISGTVVDAETRQPIKKFQVVPGVRSSPTWMNWVQGKQIQGTDGKFQYREDYEAFAYLARVDADGYLPAVSRDIKSDEGNVAIRFELKRGNDAVGTVLQPDGSPAKRAKIVLGVGGTQIAFRNGEIDATSTFGASQTEADAQGHFHFSPQPTAYHLVITHPSGYAHVECPAGAELGQFQLTAWARLEGVFKVGTEAKSGVPITFSTAELYSSGEGVPHIYCSYDVTTGKDGKFTFERMIPGKGKIGRRIMLMVNEGATEVTSSVMVAVNFPAGETTRIQLGGTGREVIGKLSPPPGFDGKVKWNFALIHVQSYFPRLPQLADPPIPQDVAKDEVKKAAWMLEWEQTEAGKAWTVLKGLREDEERVREKSPYITASVDRDGSFRIDDLPAGDYAMSVRFEREAAGSISNYRFTVPTMEDSRSDEPLDLGTLRMEKN